jgi:hypothetical protein
VIFMHFSTIFDNFSTIFTDFLPRGGRFRRSKVGRKLHSKIDNKRRRMTADFSFLNKKLNTDTHFSSFPILDPFFQYLAIFTNFFFIFLKSRFLYKFL